MKKESFNILLCALIVAGWLGLLFVNVLVITSFSNELAAFLVIGWLLISMMVIGDWFLANTAIDFVNLQLMMAC